jgi:ABC-2 type transport system permease protein
MMPNKLAPDSTRWTAAQTRAQFAAIAWLRWRIAVNAFRRKGGAGEAVARIIIIPVFGFLTLAMGTVAAGGGWYFAHSHHLDRIAWLLWAVFVLCQLLNIQVGQPGTTFDPTQLIRFPVHVRTYTAIRLFFGLLTPANIVGTMMCLAVAAGVVIAAPGLWLYALVALAVFASANVLFSRMVFAWVDRWLATRRAREIFTGLIFAFSLGVQWLHFTYRQGGPVSTQRLTAIGHMYQRALPFLRGLPPELTGSSLVAAQRGQLGSFLGLTLGCAVFSAAFLTVFALRMRTEFRGESLSDAAAVRTTKKPAVVRLRGADAGVGASAASEEEVAPAAVTDRPGLWTLSPVVQAMMGKEFLYIRRNMGIFYSLIAPVVFVFIFAGRLATRSNGSWIFPAALGYTLLGISPLSYNSFGLEGTGSQFYFLAPVRLREVFLAKNLMNFLLALIEATAVFCIVTYVAARPSLQTAATALMWAAGTLLLSTALGNRRSISAPKQIKAARAAGKQASPLSALMGMGILLASAAIASTLLGIAMFFHVQWMLVPAFALFFAAGLLVYLHSLRTLDGYAMEHREELFAELCKKE